MCIRDSFNPAIQEAYREVEQVASERLLGFLPEDLQEGYRALFFVQEEDEPLWALVKAADKLSALIKCIEEERMGNREFAKARQSLEEAVKAFDLPEVRCFLAEFLPSYHLTLDELEG